MLPSLDCPSARKRRIFLSGSTPGNGAESVQMMYRLGFPDCDSAAFVEGLGAHVVAEELLPWGAWAVWI